MISELSVHCPILAHTPGYFFGTGCKLPFTPYSTRLNSTRSRNMGPFGRDANTPLLRFALPQ